MKFTLETLTDMQPAYGLVEDYMRRRIDNVLADLPKGSARDRMLNFSRPFAAVMIIRTRYLNREFLFFIFFFSSFFILLDEFFMWIFVFY